MKVGMSLSFCVSDIVKGKVSLDEIRFISTGTCVKTSEQWDKIIASYQETYWRKFPQEGERITRLLIEQGKILQPRLEGLLVNIALIVHDPWISEDEYNSYIKQHGERI